MRHIRPGLLALLLAVALSLPTSAGLAASFTVDSIGDGADSNTLDGVCDDGTGKCTLRAAIMQANASVGADTIAFSLPGPSPYSIAPASPLPAVSDTLTIDGTTQPGFSGTPIVEIRGDSAGANADGLHLSALTWCEGWSSTASPLTALRFREVAARALRAASLELIPAEPPTLAM